MLIANSGKVSASLVWRAIIKCSQAGSLAFSAVAGQLMLGICIRKGRVRGRSAAEQAYMVKFCAANLR
jgi:hypothetical protein